MHYFLTSFQTMKIALLHNFGVERVIVLISSGSVMEKMIAMMVLMKQIVLMHHLPPVQASKSVFNSCTYLPSINFVCALFKQLFLFCDIQLMNLSVPIGLNAFPIHGVVMERRIASMPQMRKTARTKEHVSHGNSR